MCGLRFCTGLSADCSKKRYRTRVMLLRHEVSCLPKISTKPRSPELRRGAFFYGDVMSGLCRRRVSFRHVYRLLCRFIHRRDSLNCGGKKTKGKQPVFACNAVELNGTVHNFRITVRNERRPTHKVVITHIAATRNQRKNYTTLDHTCDARLDFYLAASLHQYEALISPRLYLTRFYAFPIILSINCQESLRLFSLHDVRLRKAHEIHRHDTEFYAIYIQHGQF